MGLIGIMAAMTEPNLFWPIFTAVLAALMLAGMFFGALISYMRLEREGREHQATFNYWIGMLLPIAFLVMGVLTVIPRG
ncbi:cytochrome bd-type quinol oxidase subunit 1 [Aureimonas pseudogalii]|uniref:Cytochrome bd-type quinol oxidase subunit 1 n=1 Tax=Aureimonas pseudogalii TaxID=1744844 RepID=A0A7W6H2M0_9HYPH|nr:cytochrome bd-type quinol oxidase subunit 1 [Aureimonas pseudogalii]